MIIIREHINNHTSPLANANYSLASVAFASINHHFPDLESQSSHVNQPDKHEKGLYSPPALMTAAGSLLGLVIVEQIVLAGVAHNLLSCQPGTFTLLVRVKYIVDSFPF